MLTQIRRATINDLEFIHACIHALADFEQLANVCLATIEILEKSLFNENPIAHALIVSYNNENVGLAIYFHNFSTFTGRNGLYVEDLYISPEFRGKGIGEAVFKYLAKIAVEKDCSRFEFQCLDWNDSAIKFYKRMGAFKMDGWSTFRIQDEALRNLAA